MGYKAHRNLQQLIEELLANIIKRVFFHPNLTLKLPCRSEMIIYLRKSKYNLSGFRLVFVNTLDITKKNFINKPLEVQNIPNFRAINLLNLTQLKINPTIVLQILFKIYPMEPRPSLHMLINSAVYEEGGGMFKNLEYLDTYWKYEI